MIGELGHVALVLALAAALYQTSVPLYGATAGDLRLMRRRCRRRSASSC